MARVSSSVKFGLALFALVARGGFAQEPSLEGYGQRAAALNHFVSPATRIEVDFALTDAKTKQARVFGADDEGAGLCASLYVNSSGQFSFGAGDRFKAHPTGVPADTARHLAVLDFPARKARLFTNGRQVAERTIGCPCTRTAVHPLAVLGRSVSRDGEVHDSCAKARIYGVKVFERGALVREYVPTTQAGVPGLKDRVGGAFAEYAWRVPHWEAIFTQHGALTDEKGHVQGICVATNAIYLSMAGGIAKTDWRGRLIKKAKQSVPNVHTGDLCWWKGRVYAVLCSYPNGPFFGKDKKTGKDLRGCIQVLDEELNVIKSRAIARPPDGVTCIDGVLYVGLSVARMYKDKPYRGNWYGTFDAETLATVREPFMVDHGYDSYMGVQNMTTDGEFIYVNYYTPDESKHTPNFAKFDRNFKVIDVVQFGFGQGVEFVAAGKDGARRFLYCATINWMSDGALGAGLEMIGFLQFGEWDAQGVRDVTRYNRYPFPSHRWR